VTPPRTHVVEVEGVPTWMPAARLLGPDFEAGSSPGHWRAERTPRDAADVEARLRGLGFGGRALEVRVSPPLGRAVVRAARAVDARRRRETTPGFTRAGTRLDAEGRWSLTPEAIALEWGRFALGCGVTRVADLGCGVGGNSIGFARAGLTVVAVERDAERLACAQHNARLYGVEDRITFVHGDAVALAPTCAADLWFCDPPWGEDWHRTAVSPDDLSPLPALFERREGRALWAKVPPSTDLARWSEALTDAVTIEPVFGRAEGDARRVKCLWIRCAANEAVAALTHRCRSTLEKG